MENGFLTAFLPSHLFHFCGVTTILFKASAVGYLLWCEEQGRAKPGHCCRRGLLSRASIPRAALQLCKSLCSVHKPGLEPQYDQCNRQRVAKESGCFRNVDGWGRLLLLVCTIFIGSITTIICVYYFYMWFCIFLFLWQKYHSISLAIYCLCKLQL